jgi:DUF4097 and DUF4098 domain-containing protein YvlB
VQLIAADRTDTTVEVLPADASKSRDVKAAEQTTVDYRDGVLQVEVPVKNQLFGPSGSIEVTVQLPAGSRVEAKAAATEFRAVGRLGDVTFDGAYDQIKVDEATSARITAVAGDIWVGRLTGPAQLTTTKGDIHLTEAASGQVTLRTDMGDIEVCAAPGVSAALDAGTSYGRISNALKNDGATQLDIHATTTYGDITARSL